MKRYFLFFAIISVIFVGCSQEKSYSVWVESSTSSKETVDLTIERLSDAKVDFIIDEHGNVLVNQKEMDIAVACCT